MTKFPVVRFGHDGGGEFENRNTYRNNPPGV